eukprot:TRINITY_DN6324_c0_g1_i1.p2 TRINITY_DN6324_c0_g1~~TRINITY_DN6324_c0_g1_i1.p2  ORF type:complete len:124 (-),score=17.63 TRINITY_DN6324_c0_g1_i1:424-795(-)
MSLLLYSDYMLHRDLLFFILFFFFLMIRRPPRSTLSSSSAASDVYKRQDISCGSGANPCRPKQHRDSSRDPWLQFDKVVTTIDRTEPQRAGQGQFGLVDPARPVHCPTNVIFELEQMPCPMCC